MLCTLGTTSIVIEGSVGLLCDFGRALLIASGQLPPVVVPDPVGAKTTRKNSTRLAERRALYRQVVEIQRAPHRKRGDVIQALRDRGLNPEGFYAWASAQPQEATA